MAGMKVTKTKETYQVLDINGNLVGRLRRFGTCWEVQPIWFPRNTWHGRARTKKAAKEFLAGHVRELRGILDDMNIDSELILKEDTKDGTPA